MLGMIGIQPIDASRRAKSNPIPNPQNPFNRRNPTNRPLEVRDRVPQASWQRRAGLCPQAAIRFKRLPAFGAQVATKPDDHGGSDPTGQGEMLLLP